MTLLQDKAVERRERLHMRGQPALERFEVVDAASLLTFSAMSSVHQVHGKATDLSGFVESAWSAADALVLEPAPRMHIGCTVDSFRTGNEMQDREMAKLIESKRFPKIAGDLRDLRPGSAHGRFIATGEITLAGLARRYEGELRIHRDGARVSLEGDLEVDVRDFGLKPITLLVLSVAPVVKVRLRAVAQRVAETGPS